MAHTNSPFSVENFDPAPDEELICSICRCVFEEPMECPCRHIFCCNCISSWLKVKKSCPICRKKVHALNLQSVVPLIKNLIAKLTMICPNRDNGCNSKISLDSYNYHVSHCLYEIIACKNKNCCSTLRRKDIERHEKNDCEFRMIMCERDCKLMIPIAKVKHHNCIKELKQQLEEGSKREESLNKHIEELTNELNTLKKSTEGRRNPTTDNFFTVFSSSDTSSSFADSFFSVDSEDNQSVSQLSWNLRPLRTFNSFTNNSSSRPVEESNTTLGTTDMSLEISSDVDNNNLNISAINNVESYNPSRLYYYSLTDFFNNRESTEDLSTDQSFQESGEVDDEFPTPAQRRILKRKRSASVVSVSSESDQAELQGRTRRRRSGDQSSSHVSSSGSSAHDVSINNNSNNNRKSRQRSRWNQLSTSTPRSIVPLEVPSSSQSSSFSEVVTPRPSGLERTRELLELFSVETDPDWEPSEIGTASEGEHLAVETDPEWEPSEGSRASEGEQFHDPNCETSVDANEGKRLSVVRSVPAAELLDSMLSDDEDFEGRLELPSTDDETGDEDYEVLVPERTYDLLLRYSQEDSEDDQEWHPPQLRTGPTAAKTVT